MIKNMRKNKDCTVVDSSVRLKEFRKWKATGKDSTPFYLHTENSGGVVFNGKPEIVRQLLKIYNTQQLFLDIKLISFLNSEGISARRVAEPIRDVLGYNAEVSNN